MFQDLDATLKAMLGDSGAPEELRAADVSFVTPDKDFKPAQDTVNLFLHDVQENKTLRNQAPLVEQVEVEGAGFLSRRPPMRVDCTYLATAWSHKTGGIRTEEEHRLLGQLLLWLSRFPVIDERFLRGGVARPPQLYPLPASVGQPKDSAGMGQFWTALGVAPRPALSLTVTLGLASPEQPEQLPPVRDVRLEQASLGLPALQGRVLHVRDGEALPVAGARVTVTEAGREAVAGRSGDFSFGNLDFGVYTLLVRVPGRPDVQTRVTYLSDRQVHNVILPQP
ncbi:Pvc16 family protein [Streptomyces sp. APSN-46.1]|uniref:Pvc16 family protein n=1 Tax=Streptomyces sp. APSN-46.1 TaxID=2929049 RepID=UPI001FB4A5F6|nr:Pvc16 family protein [Streptomyces sp. APSN-46.1]MCJ1676497.1 Pvc16 family protein [Streptomyces sp. APSN-46.1]